MKPTYAWYVVWKMEGENDLNKPERIFFIRTINENENNPLSGFSCYSVFFETHYDVFVIDTVTDPLAVSWEIQHTAWANRAPLSYPGSLTH